MTYVFFIIPMILIVVLLLGITGATVLQSQCDWDQVSVKNHLAILLLSIVPVLNWVIALVLISVLTSQILEFTDNEI